MKIFAKTIALAFAALLAGCAVIRTGGNPDGFVMLADAVPDAILEPRYYSTYNFIGDRIDGYEEPCAILSKEAAAALKEASDEAVRRGYRLKIYDAYRPQRAVAHFMRWAKDTSDTRMKQYFYPDLDKSVLFAQGYIAERSGHSRGSTVDLTLFDMKSGKELDMGGTFDWFGKESHPDWRGVTDKQFANRMILREIMTAHGFKPIDEEWWHFTLKDEPYPETYFDFPVAGTLRPAASSQSDNEENLPCPALERIRERGVLLIDKPFTHGEIGVLMRSGQDDLLAFVNDVLDRMASDGSLDTLKAKHGLTPSP